MLFSSPVFLFLFLPVVLLVYHTCFKRLETRNTFLLLISLIFYSWGEPWFVLIMMFSIFVNFWIARGIAIVDRRKFFLTLMIIFNISVLFVFKYLVFVIYQINACFGSTLVVPNIVLPIGISFFTFQSMSYAIDVYRGNVPVQKNIRDLGLYISLFPQLIAGPIVRYHDIVEELHKRKVTASDFDAGVRSFIIGLSKKVIIANNVALVADRVFESDIVAHSCLTVWLGAVSYALQIYFDFSGYSDMAIGLGRMFGFHFLENFNFPYVSKSVSEFWRRWHISLGHWFRDYVYFPLGGSRVVSIGRLFFNLFIVWLLTGLWHGANWTFVFWGLWYCLFICLEKGMRLENMLQRSYIIGHLYTILITIVGWVFFRSETLDNGFKFVKKMFIPEKIFDEEAFFIVQEFGVIIILGILLSMPFHKNRYFLWINHNNLISRLFVNVLYILICILSLSFIIKSSYNPFIYFNF